MAMTEQAAENALARVERALARVEAAVKTSQGAHADLNRRHAALRGQVADAIASLDSLIAAEARG